MFPQTAARPEEVFIVLPIPHQVLSHFTQLHPSALSAKGVKVVLADLDNTLVSYGSPLPDQTVIQWKEALDKEDITLFILSNSRKAGRVDAFAEALGVPFQSWSGKPKKKGYRKALTTLQAKPEDCLMVGDQIFTDILGATRMGIPSILVEPITLSGNLGRYLRYQVLEAPFRQAGRKQSFL